MHIFALQKSGFHLMKTINLYHSIKAYSKANIEHQVGDQDKEDAYKLSKSLEDDLATYFIANNSKYEFAINDNMDFTVQISSK